MLADGAPVDPPRSPADGRAGGKSLLLSLRNVYEAMAIALPTVIDAAIGREITQAVAHDRLGRWSRNVLDNARVDLQVVGRDHIRPGETYLVMSNHQSHYDIPVLFQVMGTNIRMIAKEELFRIPIFGKAMSAAGFISIDRSKGPSALQSLVRAQELLARGTHVWIAPEGTRSRTGELLPFKKGAFYLATQAGLPILPVTIQGTRDVLAPADLRSRAGAHVCVTLHPTVDARPYAAHGKRGRDDLSAELRRVLQSAL